MDRRHQAIENARNVLNSKIAKALLDGNKFPDRKLQLSLHRLETEQRQQQALNDNDQRLFKHKGLIYNFEPTMVVERPASPLHYQSALREYEETDSRPHYMTRLDKHKPQVYVPMPTVDAFKVVKKRKRNIWESKYTDKHLNERFRSILMKSPPLTTAEKSDLNTGWTVYRPVSRMEEVLQQKLKEKSNQTKSLAQTIKPKSKKLTLPSVTFITQLGEDELKVTARKDKRRSTIFQTISQNSNDIGASILLQPRKQQIELQFDPENMQKFEQLREKQRTDFHKFIK